MFTGLLIAMLIIAGAATVVGGGLVIASQRRRLPEGDAPAQLGPSASERALADLRAGDVVQHDGRDYLVEGVIAFDEDGHRWIAGRLTDGRDERWLIVGMERTGPGKRRLVTINPELELAGYPPETLVVGGVRYVLDKRGTATAKVSGDVGSLPASDGGSSDSVLRCRWWRYESAGDDCLVVEQWSGTYRALVGRIVSEAEVDMIPGS